MPRRCLLVVGVAVSLLVSAGPARAQLPLEVLHSFPANTPFQPTSLLRASDGAIYGMTSHGGTYSFGTIFRMSLGGDLTVLHAFGETRADGRHPFDALVEGADGHFYGVTPYGGQLGDGTVFRMTRDGVVTILHEFLGREAGDGDLPSTALVQATDGNFYGLTSSGGSAGGGTAYRITPGGELTVLYSFGQDAVPSGALIQATDGSLYGTTRQGSASQSTGAGTVFKMTLAGELTLVHAFNGTDARGPRWLLQASDGNFYGTTEDFREFQGPPATVFKLTPSGTLTVVHQFSRPFTEPRQIVETDDGHFIGIDVGAYSPAEPRNNGLIFRLTRTGVYSTVHTFGAGSDGADPGSLLKGANGYFHGTTFGGGSPMFGGTVFTVAPDDDVSIDYVFSPSPGSVPSGALTEAADGRMYGATESSGVSGAGSIFTLTTSGLFTTLDTLGYSNGAWPMGKLVQTADGTFFGTTLIGGNPPSGGALGTVFSMTPAGARTSLHSFNGGAGGAYPSGPLTRADGHFYGTTFKGGATNDGIVFKVTPTGLFTVVHSFTGAGGSLPMGGVIEGADGFLYGTTVTGGAFGRGTLYRLSTAGTFELLHSFGAGTDGAYPVAYPLQASNGRIYGTTSGGGRFGKGTVFTMTPSGSVSIWYSFRGGADGATPAAALIESSDGDLWGTAREGGTGYGTIFKLTPSGVFLPMRQFAGTNGSRPSAALLQASDGDFYGTTSSGGAGNGHMGGVAFRLTNVRCQDTVTLSYNAGTLNLGFTLMTPEPSTWTTSIVVDGRSTTLWSVTIPAVTPGVSFNVPLPNIPPSGTVGILTTLNVGTLGTLCADWKTIDPR